MGTMDNHHRPNVYPSRRNKNCGPTLPDVLRHFNSGHSVVDYIRLLRRAHRRLGTCNGQKGSMPHYLLDGAFHDNWKTHPQPLQLVLATARSRQQQMHQLQSMHTKLLNEPRRNAMVQKQSMENSECILCGSCVDTCPKQAIKYAFTNQNQNKNRAKSATDAAPKLFFYN